MVKEINGTIKFIAKTSGIKLEEYPDTWFNPSKTAKSYIKPDLKGKKITLKMADDELNVFNFITIDSDTITNKTINPTVSPSNFIDRDERISRHGSLNTALEVIKISLQNQDTTLTPSGILKLAIELAEKEILPFVKKEK